MTTSEKQTFKNIKAGSIFSPGDFPASRTASPVNAWEKKTPGTSGQKCLEQFGKYNQCGSWAKMFVDSLVGMADWYSTRCSLIWRLRDTKYSRFYFQLQASTHRTDASASGLLPTVMASDGTRRGEVLKGRKKKRPSGQIYAPNLSDLAKNGLLPTPTVMEDRTRNITKQNYQKKKGNLATAALIGLLSTPTTGGNRNSRNAIQLTGEAHQRHGVALGLMQVVEISAGILPKEFDHWEQVPNHYRNLLPTPTAVSDAKGGCTRTDSKRQNDTLAHAIHGMMGAPGKTSQLNPRFVMEMMGFPPNWTALPFQNGAPKVSSAAAMQ